MRSTDARQHYARDLDDSTWYTSARINDVTFGFPTWEGSAYRGYLWYRTRVVAGDRGWTRTAAGIPSTSASSAGAAGSTVPRRQSPPPWSRAW